MTAIGATIQEVLPKLLTLMAVAAWFFQSPISVQAEEERRIERDVKEINAIASTHGELLVSEDSPYCNWDNFAGPVCNFTSTDQVVVLPDNTVLQGIQFLLEVSNAKKLHLYPVCISAVKVSDTSFVTTSSKVNATRQVECRTWLQIFNSHADVIAHGVKELHLFDTVVQTIDLQDQRAFTSFNSAIITVESLRWEDSESIIQSSTFQRINQIVAEGNLQILDSHIDFMSADGIVFISEEMKVTNTTISYIESHGIRIMSGTVSFSNVSIAKMESLGILVESPDAFLSLANVTIHSAVENCILLPDRGRISIQNVKIGNDFVDSSSPYFKFEDDIVLLENETEIQVEKEMAECSSSSTSLICDFTGNNETIELSAVDIKGYDYIQLKNVRHLLMQSTGCDLTLELESVNGTLPHFATKTLTNSSIIVKTSDRAALQEEQCGGLNLTVLHSHLEVISGGYISNVKLINTTLRRLHEGWLQYFHVENVQIEMLDSFNLTGSGHTWNNVKLKHIYNMTVNAPLSVDNFTVKQRLRPRSLIIDHPNATTEITNGSFLSIMPNAVVVKRGHLILRLVDIRMLMESAIYVEEGASLELDRFTPLISFFGAISVATRDQVNIADSFGGPHASHEGMIHIRNPPPIPPDMGSNLTISNIHASPYCESIIMSKRCDFTNIQNATVTVDIQRSLHGAVPLEIRNASKVTLYPSCVLKLFLVKVTEATTIGEDEMGGCTTWLQAHDVNFRNITSGVHDVTLTSCTVELLSPNRMLRDVDIHNTRVQQISGLHWSGHEGIFKDSYFGEVKGVVAASEVIMQDTTIRKIPPRGLTILDEGTIHDSTIQEVASGGITVRGTLHLENVIIGSLAKNAIVARDGLLILSNVTISSSDEMSIIATTRGAVAMKDVRVAGKRVQWHGYITSNTRPDGSSVVFFNKPFDGGSKVFPTSSPEEWLVTKPPPSRRPSFTSWKMATVVLIILLVSVLFWCIYYTVQFIKLSRRTLLPQVTWQAREDQTHLLDDAE